MALIPQIRVAGAHLGVCLWPGFARRIHASTSRRRDAFSPLFEHVGVVWLEFVAQTSQVARSTLGEQRRRGDPEHHHLPARCGGHELDRLAVATPHRLFWAAWGLVVRVVSASGVTGSGTAVVATAVAAAGTVALWDNV